MRRILQSVWMVWALGAMGCATTKFESTWKDPAASAGELQGKRVGAFVEAKSEAFQRSGEDALARALTQHGVIGIPGYQLATPAEVRDEAALRQKLLAENVDALVRMRVVDTWRETSYNAAGTYGYGSPYYYWNWAGYGAGYPGLLAVDTIVRIETLVYSLPDNKLLWGGVTRTTDPTKLDATIGDVARRSINEMKKQGLVVR